MQEIGVPVDLEPEDVLGETLDFLVHCSGDREMAHLLLDCHVALSTSTNTSDDGEPRFDVTLTAPRHVYDAIAPPSKAYNSLLFYFMFSRGLDDRPVFNALHVRLAAGESTTNVISLPTNQARGGPRKVIWNRLTFRSETELRLAKALDRAGALFFPNCGARLGHTDDRKTREPDFLVCHEGKWGRPRGARQ